jgi:hypothetical protein
MSQILGRNQVGFGILIEQDAGGFVPERNTHFINEGKFSIDPSQPIYIDCILQKYDVENRNGRVYPEKILKKEVDNYIQLIDTNSALNEVNHPNDSNINLNNVGHLIKKVWWEGNVLWGTLEIITSPGYMNTGVCSLPGDGIAELLKRGVKLGISSRGIGSIKNVGGKNIVQDDFELICFDLVASPSTPGAYLMNDTIRTSDNKKQNIETYSEQEIKNIKVINENLHNILDKFLL